VGAKAFAGEIAAQLGNKKSYGRSECALALATLEAKEFIRDIVRAMREREEYGAFLRIAAITALARLGAVDQAGEIALFLQSDDPALRGAAIESLGRLDARKYAPAITKLLGDAEEYSPLQEADEPAPPSTTVGSIAAAVLGAWK
jgi:HEAT repeat protein